MPVLEDIRIALDNYPTDSVDVTITDFAVIGGGVLNVGDKAQFKVQVSNNGQLDMLSTIVRVYGSQYADVSKDNVTFTSQVTSAAMTVSGHGSQKTALFYLKAKAVTSGAKDIVSARVDAWDAGWDHILKGHSTSGPTEGKLNKDVLAT